MMILLFYTGTCANVVIRIPLCVPRWDHVAAGPLLQMKVQAVAHLASRDPRGQQAVRVAMSARLQIWPATLGLKW